MVVVALDEIYLVQGWVTMENIRTDEVADEVDRAEGLKKIRTRTRLLNANGRTSFP